MTVREIRLFGDPILRTVADEITSFDDSIRALAQDLLDTVDDPGRAGVAAPQIGVPLRAFSYDTDDRRGVLINPIIVTREGTQDGDEGCLSVPGLWYPTTRSAYVVAKGLDVNGEPVEVAGEGPLARCLEHEVDHLDGIVYLKRLDRETRKRAMRDVRESAWFNARAPQAAR
ncbi:MAG TPA: peptide deformylase [Jiangellaceae bacterium]